MRAIDIAIVAAGSVLTMAGLSVAQTVEFRIVERTNQSTPTIADPILDFAVQARVMGAAGGVGIRSFGFDLRTTSCEADAWGTLTRDAISNADGTYTGFPISANNTVGRGGLAAQFAFTAASDPEANGLVNATGTSHVNNLSVQDIGSVRGLGQGTWLVRPVDADGNGVPDTSPQNGQGAAAPNGSTATLDPVLAQTYFGSDGIWVDVYRFRHTITSFSPCRSFQWTVVPTEAPTVFSQMTKVNGLWQATPVTAAASVQPYWVIMCLGGPSYCPGDYNRDLVLSVDDIFDYVNAWFAGCLGQAGSPCSGRTVDSNCDGLITVQDLLDFLNRWLGPC